VGQGLSELEQLPTVAVVTVVKEQVDLRNGSAEGSELAVNASRMCDMQVPALALFAGHDRADVVADIDAVQDAQAVIAQGGEQEIGREPVGDTRFDYVLRLSVTSQGVKHGRSAVVGRKIARVRQGTSIRDSTLQFLTKSDELSC
jgi:hypothetical protein